MRLNTELQVVPPANPLWIGSTSTLTLTKLPGFAYPGGKNRLSKKIVAEMPRSGDNYVEPFAGRGNVSFAALTTLQYESWQLNDIRMAPFFNAIVSHGNTIEVPEHTFEEFLSQKQAAVTGDPIALLLAPYLTYSGSGYGAGYRSAKGSPLRHHYETTLRRAHQILGLTQPLITNVDWEKTVADLGENDFVYLDPPYLGAIVHGYGPKDLDHLEMIAILQAAKFRWLLSEYDQPLYRESFGEPFWRKDVQLRSTNFRKDETHGKARRIECMWKNY
jgi:DNA adenine methylase